MAGGTCGIERMQATKDVLIDASSAILLYKIGLFARLAKIYRLSMLDSVVAELTFPAAS